MKTLEITSTVDDRVVGTARMLTRNSGTTIRNFHMFCKYCAREAPGWFLSTTPSFLSINRLFPLISDAWLILYSVHPAISSSLPIWLFRHLLQFELLSRFIWLFRHPAISSPHHPDGRDQHLFLVFCELRKEYNYIRRLPKTHLNDINGCEEHLVRPY